MAADPFEETSESPSPDTVNKFHENCDVDRDSKAHHHTLGRGVNQAAPGSHNHNGENSPYLFDNVSVGGSLTDGTALKQLLTALASLGLRDET